MSVDEEIKRAYDRPGLLARLRMFGFLLLWVGEFFANLVHFCRFIIVRRSVRKHFDELIVSSADQAKERLNQKSHEAKQKIEDSPKP